MKGQQAFGEVTHALMRKHNPTSPGYPEAHLCPAKSMVATNRPIGTFVFFILSFFCFYTYREKQHGGSHAREAADEQGLTAQFVDHRASHQGGDYIHQAHPRGGEHVAGDPRRPEHVRAEVDHSVDTWSRNTIPQFRVLGLGFRVWGLGFRVKGLGFRV